MSTALPSVSVVVAARNAEATIADCIDSLVTLRYPGELLEILVVDNGSTDGTRDVLGRFGEAIAVVEEPRPGPAAARNSGVRRARGEVVALTDADSTVDPDWLAELVAPLVDESVGIVGGPILAHRPANAAELYGEAVHDQRRAILEYRPPHVATGNWAARRALFEIVGPFDEERQRSSDVEFSYRVVAAGYRLAFSPGAVVHHHNERTLGGLVREAWLHGRYGGRVARELTTLVAEAKARSQATLGPAERFDPVPLSRYALAFMCVKRLGRLAARVEVTADRALLALRGLPGSRPPEVPRP